MRKLILSALVVASTTTYGQSLIDSVNANVNGNDTLYMEVFEGETDPFATIGGTDEDGADNLTITLSNTSDFVLSPASANVTAANGDIGTIAPAVAFDADVQDKYVFNTTITDDDGLAMTAVTKVQVKRRDIIDIKPYSMSVAENTMTVKEFQLIANRLKANGDTADINNGNVIFEILSVDNVAYSLNANNVAPWPFYIGSISNKLEVTAPLNYEEQSQYLIEVKATRGSNSFTKVLKLNVTKVNELPYRIYVK